jgi:hypothetical protein
MRKLKYKLEQLRYWKILFSPFKPFHIRFYVGKTAIGVPYFYPRRWVKSKTKPGHMEAKSIKVGFDSCGLGYKTKWTDTDFRYEWGPVFTFVFFGYQIAWMIGHTDVSHYWEAWLYYEYATDKTKSKRERVAQCRREFPMTWKIYHKSKETWETESIETIDYYNRILKRKYLK